MHIPSTGNQCICAGTGILERCGFLYQRLCVKIMAKGRRVLKECHHEKTHRLYICYFISLDSNGGHHDYNNVSGLGSYHYHHGYDPHLHENGVCPYEGGGSTDSTPTAVTYDSYSNTASVEEETVTMTEDELEEYVQNQVADDPSSYGVVSQEDYDELKQEHDQLEERLSESEQKGDNSLLGIGVTAAIGAACCYGVYRKYR